MHKNSKVVCLSVELCVKTINRRNYRIRFMGTFVRLVPCPTLRIPVTRSTSVGTSQCWPKSSHRSRRQNDVQPFHWPRSISIGCSMVLDGPDRDSNALGNPATIQYKIHFQLCRLSNGTDMISITYLQQSISSSNNNRSIQ